MSLCTHLEMGCKGEISKRGSCTEAALMAKCCRDQTCTLEMNPQSYLLICALVCVVEQTWSLQTGFLPDEANGNVFQECTQECAVALNG